MGKRQFSGLETTLIVLFCIVAVIACVLIGLLASGQSGVKTTGMYFPLLLQDQSKNIEWELLPSAC